MIVGFSYVAEADAQTLILGSMPGKVSLQERRYYANKRNAFWPICAELFGFDLQAPYAERLTLLTAEKIALWDVVRCCERISSLDSDIVATTVEPNDFSQFYFDHPSIRRVFFNGAKSEQLYRRHVTPTLNPIHADISYYRLPSTSPAYAAMSYPKKLSAWRAIV